MTRLSKDKLHTLQRKATIDVAKIISARFPAFNTDPDHDLESLNGKKIKIRATYLSLDKKYAHWGLPYRLKNKSFNRQIDYLVAVAYYSTGKIAMIVCVPKKRIPKWNTSFSVTLKLQYKRRALSWQSYIVTKEQLIDKFKK